MAAESVDLEVVGAGQRVADADAERGAAAGGEPADARVDAAQLLSQPLDDPLLDRGRAAPSRARSGRTATANRARSARCCSSNSARVCWPYAAVGNQAHAERGEHKQATIGNVTNSTAAGRPDG